MKNTIKPTLNIEEKGKLLKISIADVSAEFQAEMNEWTEKREADFARGELAVFAEDLFGATSSPFNNGWSFESGLGNTCGLSEAPFISNDHLYNEDGEFELPETYWFFDNYMITNFLEALIERHEIYFTLAE